MGINVIKTNYVTFMSVLLCRKHFSGPHRETHDLVEDNGLARRANVFVEVN